MAVTYTYTKKINTYNGSTVVSGRYTLKLVITFTKLSTNYTRLKMVGYIKSNDSSYYSYNLNAGAKNILKISNEDGTIQYNKTFYADYDTRNTGTYYKMWTKTVDLKHGSDGARAIRFSWTFNDRALPGWRPNGTLYAPSSTGRISLTTTTYKVSYNANGGTGAPSAQTKTHGKTLTLSSTKPTRVDGDGLVTYRFVGWSTSKTAKTATYKAGGSYTANAAATLYAVWSTSVNSFDVVYNANGGTGAPSKQTKTKGTALTLSTKTPTRYGYTFKGWATNADATTAAYSAGGSYTTDDDVVLYAVWTPWTHTVNFNLNGGSNAPASFTATTGVDTYISNSVIETITDTVVDDETGVETQVQVEVVNEITPEKAEHVFRGWNTASDGSGTMYQMGDLYNHTQDGGTVTLYAMWAKEDIRIYNTGACSCISFAEADSHGFVKGGFVNALEFIEGSSVRIGNNNYMFVELIEK